MRAPRSLLLILGGTVLVVGAVLAFATYSVPLRDLLPGGPGKHQILLSQQMYELVQHGTQRCERPFAGAFGSIRTGPGEWFNYRPGGGAVPCTSSARWRLGGGVVLIVSGIVALVVWTRQSRLGRDAVDDDVSASSPPPGAGSSGPSPGGPSPS